MAMGERALPFIRSEFEKEPSLWTYALTKIARKNIAENANSAEELKSAWLEWIDSRWKLSKVNIQLKTDGSMGTAPQLHF
jgi:hypothetical protein